jgi:uncharacterized protein (UPF0264 family)
VTDTSRPSLLVSVASAAEARVALEGGADVIDAKDPGRGALGAVTLDILCAIADVVRERRPLSAALGDAATEEAIARDARAYVRAGATIVKVGLAGVASPPRARALLRAAARAAGPVGGRVAAVADADATNAPPPFALIRIAAAAGVAGVLRDTSDQGGPALPELMTGDALARWVDHAHGAGLWTAVAGRLTAATLSCAWRAGADVAGVRGAACDGGRSGLVSRDRVRALRALLDAAGIRPAAAAQRPADRPAPRPPTGAGAGLARSTDPRDPLLSLPEA